MLTFHKPSATALVSYIFFAASIGMVIFSLSMIMNVDVIRNWRLILPEQPIHAGQTIVVQSIYEKRLNVTGTSTRYVECKTKDGKTFVRYPVSSAVANRGAGVGGTGIVFTVPEVIPDLPTTCRFNITIDYAVLAFRHVIESTSSEEFTLLPKETTSTTDESQKTSQTEGSTSGLGSADGTQSVASSSSQSTPSTNYNQRDISQGDAVADTDKSLQPTPQQMPNNSRPSIIEVLLAPVTNLLGR